MQPYHKRRPVPMLPKNEETRRQPWPAFVGAVLVVLLLVLGGNALRTPQRMTIERQVATAAPRATAPAPPTPVAPTPTLFPPEPGIIPLGAPATETPPVVEAPVPVAQPPAEPPAPCWQGVPRPNPDDLPLCWDGVPWRIP